jgi:hypothetical protein
MPAIATKLFTGDMLSVSPVLGAALAARALHDKGTRLPRVNPAAQWEHPRFAVATGFDNGGLLGVAMLTEVLSAEG